MPHLQTKTMKSLKNVFLLSAFICLLSHRVSAQLQLVMMDTMGYHSGSKNIWGGAPLGVVNDKSVVILTRDTLNDDNFPRVELYATDSLYNRKLIHKWQTTDSMISIHSWDFKKAIVRTDTMIYFLAENSFFSELWQTDGTSTGTKRLIKLRHGTPKSYIDSFGIRLYSQRSLALINNNLIFRHVDSTIKPYDHRNTTVHTYNLKSSEFDVLVASVLTWNNRTYNFQAEDYAVLGGRQGLYVSDGTPVGTHRLITADTNYVDFQNLMILNEKLYYAEYSANHDSILVYEYKRTDRHDSTLTLLWKGENHDFGVLFLNSFVSYGNSNKNARMTIKNDKVKLDTHNWHFVEYPQYYTRHGQLSNGKFIVKGRTENHGFEPWVTDLTEKGSYMLIDSRPGKSHSNVYKPVSMGNLVLFSDGYSTLYQTDGTRKGTHKIKHSFNGGSTIKDRTKFLGHPRVSIFHDNGGYYLAHLIQDGITINGLVFYDENGDGKHDKGEEGVFDQRIQIGPGNISVGTDNNGIISGYVKNQDCTAKLVVPKGWKLTSPNTSYSLKKDSLNLVDLVWGIKPEKALTDFDVDLAVGRTHCTRGKGGIYITNKGNHNITPTVDLKLDPSCTIKSANMAYTVGSNNVVTFKPKNIQSFVNRYISFEYSLSGVQGGDTVTHTLLTSFSSVSKSDAIEYITTCSYDPNDKQVSPIPTKGTKGVKLDEESELKYTIRFQNTGNDTAFDVTIYDTLDSKLDFESLRIVGSTHAMTHTRSGDVVKFFFQNIYLPDSTTDEPGSNGHLVFAIKPKAGYAHKTLVRNKAGIVFDVNKPIITNTVDSKLLKSLPVKAATITSATYVSDQKVQVEWKDVAQNIDSLILERSVNDTLSFSPIFKTDQSVRFYEDATVDKANDYYYRLRTFNPYEGAVSNTDSAKFVVGTGSIQNTLNIYPNPADEFLTIEMPDAMGPFDITLIDMTGKIVLTKTTNGKSVSIDVSQLKSGQYRVRIEGNGKIYSDRIQIK